MYTIPHFTCTFRNFSKVFNIFQKQKKKPKKPQAQFLQEILTNLAPNANPSVF
jgi:hypothetical protein